MELAELSAVIADQCQRVIAVINGKGGVLKTSVTVNVAAALARAGMKVCIIDLDVSGGVSGRFGFKDAPEDDKGLSMVQAIVRGARLEPVAVRDGIDLVFGGIQLQYLIQTGDAHDNILPTGAAYREFALRVSEIADDYDIIMIDTPPLEPILQRIGIAAAAWCLVPMKTDHDSIDGVSRVAPIVKAIREELNPNIAYLGAVICDHNRQATTVLASMREALVEVSSLIPLFDTTIRNSAKVPHICRKLGKTVFEIEYDAEELKKQRLEALKQRRQGDTLSAPKALTAGKSVEGLVSDYENLAAEICGTITRAEEGRK